MPTGTCLLWELSPMYLRLVPVWFLCPVSWRMTVLLIESVYWLLASNETQWQVWLFMIYSYKSILLVYIPVIQDHVFKIWSHCDSVEANHLRPVIMWSDPCLIYIYIYIYIGFSDSLSLSRSLSQDMEDKIIILTILTTLDELIVIYLITHVNNMYMIYMRVRQQWEVMTQLSWSIPHKSSGLSCSSWSRVQHEWARCLTRVSERIPYLIKLSGSLELEGLCHHVGFEWTSKDIMPI